VLIILSGTSGVGKNTIINSLLNKYSDKYTLLPTYTTREMRLLEKQGEPYFFISEKEFYKKIEENDLYEHEVVHGHYYGTSRNLLLEKKETGKILLKDIDVRGTQKLVEIASNDIKIVTIFLYVQSIEELKNRLLTRGEKDIELRLSRYSLEMEYAKKYDYLIDNENKDYTVSIINSLIELEAAGIGLLPTHDVSEKAIQYYIDNLRNGEKIDKTIDIIHSNSQWFIVHGHSLYLASMFTGIKVTKRVINNFEKSQYLEYFNNFSTWEQYMNRLNVLE